MADGEQFKFSISYEPRLANNRRYENKPKVNQIKVQSVYNGHSKYDFYDSDEFEKWMMETYFQKSSFNKISTSII